MQSNGAEDRRPLETTVGRVFDLSPQVSKHIVLQNTRDSFRVFVDDIDITYWIAADGLGDIEVGSDGSRRIPVVLTASKMTVRTRIET